MSYDIFFVRRDPGQTIEEALEDVEESYDGGDPGPLTDEDLEVWDSVLPVVREVLGPDVEVTEDEETRELSDPTTGIGLTFFQGELEIHVPESRMAGDEDLALMSTVYELAREIENATGLEGYDPQLGEPVSDTSETSPTRRRWADDEPEDEAEPAAGAWTGTTERPARALEPEPFAPEPAAGRPARPRRWWEFWKP
jgi:hypothetical protein